MIRLTDYAEVRFESSDADDLLSVLTQLQGQRFLSFLVSYGDELRLNLGEPIPFTSPRLRGRSRGAYVLGARASSWVVVGGATRLGAASDDVQVEGATTSRVEIATIETSRIITPEAYVVDVAVTPRNDGFAVMLKFSDQSVVLIDPRFDPDEPPDASDEPTGVEIADWELLTPHSRILRVGPGRRWSYVDSTRRPGG